MDIKRQLKLNQMTNQLQQQAREEFRKTFVFKNGEWGNTPEELLISDNEEIEDFWLKKMEDSYESGRESMREEVIAIVKSWQTDEPEEVNLILENILSALNPKEYNQGSYWYSKEEDGYKDKNCKNCKDLHNGSIIKVDNNNKCLFCGRKVGSNQSQ